MTPFAGDATPPSPELQLHPGCTMRNRHETTTMQERMGETPVSGMTTTLAKDTSSFRRNVTVSM
jgi:hypothetical protein